MQRPCALGWVAQPRSTPALRAHPCAQIHKIMAGLLDQYVHLGSQLALDMALSEAEYFWECVLRSLPNLDPDLNPGLPPVTRAPLAEIRALPSLAATSEHCTTAALCRSQEHAAPALRLCCARSPGRPSQPHLHPAPKRWALGPST